MARLSKAQRGIVTAAAQDGGLVVTEQIDRLIVEQVVWHKLCHSTERPDGSTLLVATEAGRVALGGEPPAAAATEEKLQPEPEPTPPAKRAPSGKLGALVTLLRRPQGAALSELVEATGWQTHSVRGAMSGALKKKLGLNITSEKTDAGRVYRIAAEAAQ